MSDNYKYLDSRGIGHEIVIEENDFALVQKDKVLTDQKMQSKPTTFLKDALKRFAKNKSSVAGAMVLGFLLLLTAVLPWALQTNITKTVPELKELPAKLFDAGTGWWDGCKTFNNVTIDIEWDKYDADGTLTGLPADTEERYIVNGRKGITLRDIGYYDEVSAYGHGGYARINFTNDPTDTALDPTYRSYPYSYFDFESDIDEDDSTPSHNYKLTVETASIADFEDWPSGYGTQVPYGVYFEWKNAGVTYSVPLEENINAFGTTRTYEFNDHIAEFKEALIACGRTKLEPINEGQIVIRLSSNDSGSTYNNLLLKKIKFEAENLDGIYKTIADNLSIDDANDTILQTTYEENKPLPWSVGPKTFINAYRVMLVKGDYREDSYEKQIGTLKRDGLMTFTNMKKWYEKGYIDCDMSIMANYDSMSAAELKVAGEAFLPTIKLTESGKIHCPLVLDEDHPMTVTAHSVTVNGKVVKALEFNGYLKFWQWLHPERTSCPRFIFGTNRKGFDMLRYTFTGLAASLGLGVITFVVCFAIGLVYGAVAGYYGGWTDILMERFTDILGGIPWIVMMTLAIMIFGRSFLVFAIALCATGWIGTAGLTRTQFYRFKNREYILAARTLGAKDSRLIFRHILPNAVGTLVTSSVLMIPGVIFEEATISYLGLGFQDTPSLGIILSENQGYISQPATMVLILFPSIIMALIMISFNLFGNGLRDALNPSLKGAEN